MSRQSQICVLLDNIIYFAERAAGFGFFLKHHDAQPSRYTRKNNYKTFFIKKGTEFFSLIDVRINFYFVGLK